MIHHATVVAVLLATADSNMAGRSSVMDYEPIPLHRLAATSDLVVEGKISRVTDRSFLLNDLRVLVGETPKAPMEVTKFRYWPGTSRWTDYAAGQSVVLFLERSPGSECETAPCWRIRGIGGEGEMPLQDGFVYLHGLWVEPLDFVTHEVQGATMQAHRIARNIFAAAIRDYRRCFHWRGDPKPGQRPTIEQLCQESELSSYRHQSPLHAYLADATLKKIAGP